jgi:SAM-dependent methyltransferase
VSDPQGLAFDALTADYDRGRYGWPRALLDGVYGNCILDLAAGTGKLTALLVERFTRVIAVEPLVGMRAALERNVPKAEVLAGSAEWIPLDDVSVDAVFVAEAFHWFDSHAAVREVSRVLRPGGALVVCFNEWRSGYEPPLTEAARAVLEAAWAKLPPPGGPKVESGEWRRGFAGAPFTPLEERAFEHEWKTDREGVAAYYVSTSSMGMLPEDERVGLREQLVALLPDVRYRLPLTARVYRTRRL